MSPVDNEEKIERIRRAVDPCERMGVSEFARSKDWRDRLPVAGCIEVVDRNGVVGYLIAPEYARALSARIDELEQQAEADQIAAMFAARASRTDVATGEDLKAQALAYFDENANALLEVVNDG